LSNDIPQSMYLAGPMTNIPRFNFPLFDSVAQELRDQGFDITSPAEEDGPRVRDAVWDSETGNPADLPKTFNYGETLSRDIRIVLDKVDGVCVLPYWQSSTGACMEVYAARRVGKPVVAWDVETRTAIPVDNVVLAQQLAKSLFHAAAEEVAAQQPPPLDGGNRQYTGGRVLLVEEPDTKPVEGIIRPDIADDIYDAINQANVELKPATSVLLHPANQLRLDGERPTQLWGLPVRLEESLPVGSWALVTDESAPIREWPDAPNADTPLREEDFAHATGEVRITSETGGQKGSKPVRLDLVPPEPLWELARVYAFGAEKYDDHNYLRGYDWSLSYAAMLRHLTLWWNGESIDPETGLSHLAHGAWHTFALMAFQQHELGTDDRIGGVIEHGESIQRTGRSEEART
jgi:hypothetical protein